MLDAKIFEDIFNANQHHQVVRYLDTDGNPLTGTTTIEYSRGEANIQLDNKRAMTEGIYMFYLDKHDNIYHPHAIINNDSSWKHIKGFIDDSVKERVSTTIETYCSVLDNRSRVYRDAMLHVYGIDIDDYDVLELKATRKEKLEPRKENNFNSREFAKAFKMPQPKGKLTEGELEEYNQSRRFIAVVYNNGYELTIVDIGTLIDFKNIDMEGLEEIFTYFPAPVKARVPDVYVRPKPVINGHLTVDDNGNVRVVDSAKLTQFLAETISAENSNNSNPKTAHVDVIVTGVDFGNVSFWKMTRNERISVVKDQYPNYRELEDGAFAVVYDVLGKTYLNTCIDMDKCTSFQDSWVYESYEDAMKDLNDLVTSRDEPKRASAFIPVNPILLAQLAKISK